MAVADPRRASRRCAELTAIGVPIGVVSQRQRADRRRVVAAAACARRARVRTPMRVVVDSHVVGVAKPDPAIFDHALPFFEGIDRSRDRLRRRLGDDGHRRGARAAGLHPILLDPYDDHPDADFDRIRSLIELVERYVVG